MIDKIKVLIEVSNSHVHLSREHIDILFGKDYELKKMKQLSQPGEFATEEKVTLVNKNRNKENTRVLGPERGNTQVELSRTDAIKLKIDAPLRASDNIENTPGIKLVGPKGSVDLEKGVIIVQRHIHISEKEAEKLNLKNNQLVKVEVSGERGLTFDNILVRIDPNSKLVVHIDTDEGNAAGIEKSTYGELIF